MFRVPKDQLEREKWLAVLPPRENFLDPDKFFICETQRHWPADPSLVKLQAAVIRPAIPPSAFNVPKACLPTGKPSPRPPKTEMNN